MTREDLTPDGPELAEVITNDDGTVTHIWTDGTRETVSAATPAMMARQRAAGIATQQFFRRKRRLWPQPRT